MPGRTPRDALHAYVEPLQRALSCVTTAIFRNNGHEPIGDVKVLTMVPGAAVIKGQSRLYISAVQHYRVIEDRENGPFRVSTAYYRYMMEDEDGSEILGYHWHPEGDSPFTRPHLHLGCGSRIEVPGIRIDEAHLPTGRVAFEDFIELLIGGFEVPGRRQDWKQLLDASASLFRKYSNWW